MVSYFYWLFIQKCTYRLVNVNSRSPTFFSSYISEFLHYTFVVPTVVHSQSERHLIIHFSGKIFLGGRYWSDGRGKQYLKTACVVWRIKTIVDMGQPVWSQRNFSISQYFWLQQCATGKFSCIIYGYSEVNTQIVYLICACCEKSCWKLVRVFSVLSCHSKPISLFRQIGMSISLFFF